MTEIPRCELCGEPMPEGERMFKFHGYSGSCPKPALSKAPEIIRGYAMWHPEHGFSQPYHFEGPLAYVRADDAADQVREMNREGGQDTRKGWRMVPVEIRRVP